MESAAEVLIIILSVTLSIFLIVAIVLFVYLIRLSSEIQKVAEATHRTVDEIESTVKSASKLISPVFVAELIGGYIKRFTKQSKKKR